MSNKREHDKVDLSESSVYREEDNEIAERGDAVTDTDLDRLEGIAGETDQPEVFQGRIGRALDQLYAETEEEVDALKTDLTQTDEPAGSDGSGRVVDSVAEAELANFTEVGPALDDRGAHSVEPGREDTSRRLRREHPHTITGEVPRTESIVEGNLDEPMDETRGESKDLKVDEGRGG